jgi:hypothetical protein
MKAGKVQPKKLIKIVVKEVSTKKNHNGTFANESKRIESVTNGAYGRHRGDKDL